MIKIFGDFESYYDSKTFTLRKMTPVEYIKSALYETIGCAVAIDDKKPIWLEGDKVATLLRRITQPYMWVSHNTLFDACILAFRYDIHPPLLADTMSMARALLMPFLANGRVSLDSVATHLGLPPKGNAIHNVNGYRLADLLAQPALYQEYQEYSKHDAVLCRGIFKQLSPKFPPAEFVVNDMILRMATRPQFDIDDVKLREHKIAVVQRKSELLAECGVSKLDLMSNDKLAVVLEGVGIDPPMKISPATGEKTYAFAKTDEAFNDLLEHENEDVQAIVAARLGVRSTLEETRSQRFLDIASATWDGNKSWMPIALRYSGAHTHRFSGDWKLNQQNLPSRKSTALRESLIAPPGHVVMPVDAAQIEARLTAWLAGETQLVEGFRAGTDIYAEFASDIYGYPVPPKQKTPERFLGKTSILGLGFGMGNKKFYHTVHTQARDQGLVIDFDAAMSERTVNFYRNKYLRIKSTWKMLDHMIANHIYRGETGGTFGPCKFERGAVLLPNGLRLFYHDLQYKDGQWSFRYGRARKYLYGGKLLENVVQALDRVAIMEAALRIRKRTKEIYGEPLRLAHQVHDELIYLPREEDADEIEALLLEEVSREPVWAPGLPLSAEVGRGPNYGKTK